MVAAATVGTHVFYKLSEAATTTFTVDRKGTGHKKNGKCVAGRAKHGQKACTLYTRMKGQIVRGSGTGLTSFRFIGTGCISTRRSRERIEDRAALLHDQAPVSASLARAG